MNAPIPILFTIPNFITAGSGGAMLNIIRRLDRGKFAPAVAVLKKGGRLDEDVLEMGLQLIEAPFTIPAHPYPTFLARARFAARVFRPYHFALWHSFHYADDYSEPVIARLAGARGWIYTKKNMNWRRRAWYLRTLFAVRVAAQNTDMLKDFFVQPIFARKTRLIPRGVDIQKFAPTSATDALHRELRIPDGQHLIACVAHLVPVKGHPTLIAALAQLENAHLLLAGSTTDAAYTAQLQQQVVELGLEGRVHFLGNVSDIPGLLAEVEIAVLPTWDRWRKEGCPVALLEAMACGVACVATDIPGARDIIEPGVSGLLVPPEDPHALADALRRLIQNPELRMRLGGAARMRVVEHYSIEREVAAHEALYTEIAVAKGLWKTPG